MYLSIYDVYDHCVCLQKELTEEPSKDEPIVESNEDKFNRLKNMGNKMVAQV